MRCSQRGGSARPEEDDPAEDGKGDRGGARPRSARSGGVLLVVGHRPDPVCVSCAVGDPPPKFSMCASAASTRRLPDSSCSKPSFWKIAVMFFSTLAADRNNNPAMAWFDLP